MNRAARRLTKRDVEALLERYDDDPIDALSTALRRLLSDEPVAGGRSGRDRAAATQPEGSADDEWTDLVRAAGFDPARTTALVARDDAALDALVAELNELRTIQRASDRAPRGAIGG